MAMTSLVPWGHLELPGHNPEPRYYTRRNLDRPTLGPDIAKVLSRCAKTPITPMPWQREVCDIFGEIDPNTGMFWYRTCILILPRQGGKTTLIRGKLAHRGIVMPGARMLYTAQDRNKARQRLEETIYNPLRDSPLGKYLGRPRWAAGSEAVRFQNGSVCRIESLSKTAGHGDTLDEAHIDEAFAHRDNRIEQNVSPTMITVQGAQKLIFSAAGGPESLFLMNKRDKGRALVELGQDSRTAYIEYSAPLDADPDDPMTYLMNHPAITHTIQLDDVIDERINMDAEEFERAYLGWWPKPQATKSPIPMASWTKNYVDPDADTWQGKPLWCIDVSPDRTWSSIALAAKSFYVNVNAFVEVIDHEEGTAWLLNRICELSARFGGKRVVLDGSGAAGSLIQDLKDKGFEVFAFTPQERMYACGGFYDDVIKERVQYVDDPVLTGAMRSAAKVKTNQGESWIFSRGKSMADITPLYSVVLARYGFTTLPVEYDAMSTLG